MVDRDEAALSCPRDSARAFFGVRVCDCVLLEGVEVFHDSSSGCLADAFRWPQPRDGHSFRRRRSLACFGLDTVL